MNNKATQTPLKRSISLPLIIFYGLGTILGAGFYALLGKVAKHSAMYCPIAFLIAALVAFFTAVSYAELSSRYPVSAGEAYFVKKAFNKQWLSAVVGWLTILTGLVSAGAIAHGFFGYFQVFVQMPEWVVICGLILALGAISAWGITQSVIIAMIITLIEIGGLLLVIFIAGEHLKQLPMVWQQMIPGFSWKEWSGIFTGAFLAFYAYVGFEDMENVAEEVKDPERNLPYAMFIVMIVATLLYLLVAVTVTLALPMEQLANSAAPLALIIEHQGYSPIIISLISLIAMVNGALVQIIMATRILYGMSKQKNAPEIFGRVNKKTQTPIIATIIITMMTLAFALWLPIETLAKTTSAILLCVFILINISLIIIKRRSGDQPGSASYSILFPIIGALLSALFLAVQFNF